MPVRNQNWYDLQEGRRYPLDDRSTGVDDRGNPIADNVIVDCHIRFPESVGKWLYVSGINVSDNIVSVVISAADSETAPQSFKPIAAVSIPKPLQIGVNQLLQPLTPGVAGWVAFGSGTRENFSGRYSTPIQTIISPRCARPYRDLPIPTLGKIDLATSLSGIVKILGRTPVEAAYEIVDVAGEQAPAIVFRMTGDFAQFNPLKEYGGPCKGRPESGTCDKPGLQNINGIRPDCDGNIDISATGFAVLPFAGPDEGCGGGINIVTDRDFSIACNDGDGVDGRRKPSDLCVPKTDSSVDPTEYWPDPLEQIPIPPDIVSSIKLDDPDKFGSCYPANTCFDFTDGTSNFITKTGLFVFDEITVPEDTGCAPDAVPQSSVSSESATLNNTTYVYAAADISGINTAILRDCAANNVGAQQISAIFKITASPRRNGGIILNYNPADPFFKTPTRFVAATLDIDAGGLQVVRYNGANFVSEARTGFLVNTTDWYAISATTQPQGNATIITLTATNLTTNITANLTTAIQNFGTPTGLIGLFSNRSYTYFRKLTFGA